MYTSFNLLDKLYDSSKKILIKHPEHSVQGVFVIKFLYMDYLNL